MNHIVEDNIQKFNKYIENPPHPSYISGFIDGDGSVSIMKIKDGYNPRVSIAQSRTNVLLIICHHFGGFIQQNKTELKETRSQYTYINRGKTLSTFVDYIKDHILIKKTQIDALSEFMEYYKRHNKSDIKEKLCQTVLSANKIKIPLEINSSQLNDYYLAGFFDAEGCIMIRRKKNGDLTKGISIKITQKNNPSMLLAIQQYLGYGKIVNYYWILYSNTNNSCSDFISRIINYSIVKYNQLVELQKYLETLIIKKRIYDNEISNKRNHIYEIIQIEKHESENIDETNIVHYNNHVKIKK
jgi:hypothetical protein